MSPIGKAVRICNRRRSSPPCGCTMDDDREVLGGRDSQITCNARREVSLGRGLFRFRGRALNDEVVVDAEDPGS